ncbi:MULTISPECIES: DUF3592 domain-containing protein [unclassified Actinomadura]|uniref:DUF3592 domain-containing protein n=1 Tax=unclassified Actinomadura TaxID=2626254 RepID=UPI0011EBABB5|nr:DUF3592 domain-containing protein [Actinomadura sp. K4S16]
MDWEQTIDTAIKAAMIPLCTGLSCWAFVEAWANFRLLVRGQWIEAEIVGVREDSDGEGDPRFYPEVAFSPPDSDEVRVESKVGRLYPIDRSTRLRVRYDPAKPQRVRLEGYDRPGLFSCLAAGVAGASLAVGLVVNFVT